MTGLYKSQSDQDIRGSISSDGKGTFGAAFTASGNGPTGAMATSIGASAGTVLTLDELLGTTKHGIKYWFLLRPCW
jgi:hypothetical protein